MSKLIFGVTRIVLKRQEDLANFDLLTLTFAEAYFELRRACPRGDLRIHLSVEADTADGVGAVPCANARPSDVSRGSRPALVVLRVLAIQGRLAIQF